ncbi:MAG: 5'-deoxynucleotidase [Candidatus Latescibacteria bacterium]|nr:5'-deoxynucleotidase [Candidatus Latescibacterota bacterium]
MNHFFAYLEKMKSVKRWGLMRNTFEENIQEHSYQVTIIAHALALIRRQVFHRPVDVERILVLALYHDISEVITGDLATPIKTFNPQIEDAFKDLEGMANRRLHDMLPEELQSGYAFLAEPSHEEDSTRELIKAADRISSYIKCVSELKMGNSEFAKAAESVKQRIDDLGLPEVDYFMEKFIPSFSLTLDELN